MGNCNHSSVRTCDACMRLYCIVCEQPSFYLYSDLCKNCDGFYENKSTVKCLSENRLLYPVCKKIKKKKAKILKIGMKIPAECIAATRKCTECGVEFCKKMSIPLM